MLDKIKIGGIIYDVKVLDKFPDGDSCDGHIMWGLQEIQLLRDDNHKQEYVESVLIHEVLHGIIHHAQLKLPPKDEEQILDCIALGLYQVIKDNPDIFKEGEPNG
jgi:hypothetical protein